MFAVMFIFHANSILFVLIIGKIFSYDVSKNFVFYDRGNLYSIASTYFCFLIP